MSFGASKTRNRSGTGPVVYSMKAGGLGRDIILREDGEDGQKGVQRLSARLRWTERQVAPGVRGRFKAFIVGPRRGAHGSNSRRVGDEIEDEPRGVLWGSADGGAGRAAPRTSCACKRCPCCARPKLRLRVRASSARPPAATAPFPCIACASRCLGSRWGDCRRMTARFAGSKTTTLI